VIERLARYQLPLRHRPCNDSRLPEYKVNISYRRVSTLYHYASLLFPFSFFFFLSLRGPIRSTEGDQRHYGVARARARPWLFLFSFVSLSLPAPFPFPVCLRAFMSALHVVINRSAPRRKWISKQPYRARFGFNAAGTFVRPRRNCKPHRVSHPQDSRSRIVLSAINPDKSPRFGTDDRNDAEKRLLPLPIEDLINRRQER